MREWLKTARNEKGITMADMADKLGISESYYCLIENGDRQKKMDIELLIRLSLILEISKSRILEYEQCSSLSKNIDTYAKRRGGNKLHACRRPLLCESGGRTPNGFYHCCRVARYSGICMQIFP